MAKDAMGKDAMKK